MKSIYRLLILSLLVMSCSSESEPDPMSPQNTSENGEMISTEGKQIFRIEFNEITAKEFVQGEDKILEPAFVIVSIINEKGTPVIIRQKLALNKIGETYESTEITLDAGNYSLTEFIVTDSNDIVIALAPLEDSIMSQWAENVLPLEFTVMGEATNESITDIIESAGLAAADFGYEEINLVFSESSDFFSLTVDETELITIKTLVLKSRTGSTFSIDWGDGVIDSYVSTKTDVEEENELMHTYDQPDIYTIKINGPLELVEYFSFRGEVPNEIYQYRSNLTSVNIEKLRLLKSFHVYTGELSELDISQNIALEYLDARSQNLTSIDLTENPNLKSVYVNDNLLTSIDISQNLEIELLIISDNQISNLDVNVNSKLQTLGASRNQINSLNVSNNTNLSLLYLSSNAITELNISANTELLNIDVRDNQLTALDVSNNPKLREIDLFGNQVSTLDVTNNPDLKWLFLDNNMLSSLDLSQNSILKTITIQNNMFTELDLSLNPLITILHIGENQFTGAELDGIISQVYDHAVVNSTFQGYIDFQNNPGFSEIDPTTEDKINELLTTYNWTFNNN